MTVRPTHHPVRLALLAAALAAPAVAAPVQTPWPVDGPNETTCVAAAFMGGWYAAGDAFQDRVEVRDVTGALRRVLTRADLQAAAPWLSLDGGPDGPSGLAFSASGKLLYILVHDDVVPADGLGSDALLRYDVSTGTLTLQARLNLFDRGDVPPHLGALHHKGVVYVGTGAGQVVVYPAGAVGGSGSPAATWTLPGAGPVHGIALDRDAGTVYVANDSGLFRAPLPAAASGTPSFTQVVGGAPGAGIRGIAWGDHYGAPAQRGLYILRGPGAGGSEIDFVPAAAAATGANVVPSVYTAAAGAWHALAFTADGRLLVGADEDAVMLSDDADPRLPFGAWMADEVAQNVRFARGLIAPDGEPAGWVIDADVAAGMTRFHPATPDGAAWAVLVLIMADKVLADAQAQADVRTVLERCAGLAPGPAPTRSADGVFKHWLDPLTGNTKAGWPDEHATLSTMKIVAAAARAMTAYPDDPRIALAASRIIFRTRNWNAYLQAGTDALAFKGLAAGGPDTSSWARPFHEGILFAEQAGVYGGAAARASAARWFDRSRWPIAQSTPGWSITTANPGQFDPAFLSVYPALLSGRFRADASPLGWRNQIDAVRWSNAAWTDDNATRFSTVFSAGTSPVGYNADSLSNHPGNLTTFTALMGLAAFGETADAVGAYAAYRKGARQTFATGASLLYRRTADAVASSQPNSAGLPDVSMGALALCGLLQPGSIDAYLAGPYPTQERCPTDVNADGVIDAEDLYRQLAAPADLNGDGAAGAADAACLVNWLRRNEPAETTGR